MKNLLQVILCSLLCTVTIGQTNFGIDNPTNSQNIPERSEALNLLYEQSIYLENNGTPSEIEQNRIAIKNEWKTISPKMADLYQPIHVNLTEEELKKFKPKKNTNQSITFPSNRIWGDDLLIHDNFISGIDMEVSISGEIFVVGYHNDLTPGKGSTFYIYQSTNNGVSFSLWDEITIPIVNFTKIQIALFEPNRYLGVYILTDSDVFGVYRWDLNTQELDIQIITDSVLDFSIDNNFPVNTENTRVFATYTKSTGGGCSIKVHSARSTAGSFGFNWVDETILSNTCGREIDFAYGLSGATYASFVSILDGTLYVQTNPNYNDPASWNGTEIITKGLDIEVSKPSVCATRKGFNSDEVLVFTSTRLRNTTDDFNMTIFKRENAGPFIEFDAFGISNNNTSILYSDTWVRKEIDAEVIHLSYIVVEGTSSSLRSRTYDGTSLSSGSTISDDDNVLSKTAIAEIATDQSPCLAFADKSIVGGENIYFDSDAIIIIGIEDSAFTEFQYYPNPVLNELSIITSEVIEKIELYSVSGKKIKEFTPNDLEAKLNLENIVSGIYLMTVHSNNQTETFKIIKK